MWARASPVWGVTGSGPETGSSSLPALDDGTLATPALQALGEAFGRSVGFAKLCLAPLQQFLSVAVGSLPCLACRSGPKQAIALTNAANDLNGRRTLLHVRANKGTQES